MSYQPQNNQYPQAQPANASCPPAYQGSVPPQGYPQAHPQAQPYPQADPLPQYMSMDDKAKAGSYPPPPQPQYNPQYQMPIQQQPGPQQTQTIPFSPRMLTTGPSTVTCPHCHTTMTTRTQKKTGAGTWLFAGGCCVFGCWLGCCLIPFMIDECKDTIHFCSNCNKVLGTKAML